MRKVVTGTGPDGRSTVISDDQISGPETLWTLPEVGPVVASDLAMANAAVVNWQHVVLPPEPVMREFLAAGIPGMEADGTHQTPTTDLIHVLRGPVVLVLDTEEVELATGDLVVQQGNRHAWWNRTNEDASLLCVLLATGPAA